VKGCNLWLCCTESLRSWFVVGCLKSFENSVDYRSYMGSIVKFGCFSNRICTCALIIWTVPWQLASEQDPVLNTSLVYLKQKVLLKALEFCQKYASDHTCYARIRTIRWLIKVLTWGFLNYASLAIAKVRSVITWPHYVTLWSNGGGNLHICINHICR
jgi:hypothetical protein